MPRRRTHLTFGKVVSHLGVIVVVSAVLGVLTAGLVVPLVGAVGYGTSATARSMKNLPEELTAAPLAQRTRVLDRDGNPIATFYDDGDRDLKGTLRAFVNNQPCSCGTQGGCSSTQQMAKMTQLTQARTAA